LKIIKKDILILGGDSKLGQAIIHNFKKAKIGFISTTRDINKVYKKNIFFDFNNFQDFQIPKTIKIVYFCASITSKNICEKKKKQTRNINVIKTCKLIEKFLNLNINVIYFSTNLVFSGNNIPFFYTSKLSPQNEYALQKTMVEKYLNNQKYKNYSIIRFGKIIFKNDKLLLNWIETIKKNLQFYIIKNRFISPIYFTQAIEVIRKISLNNKFGIYQVSAKDSVSYLEIAKLFLKVLKGKSSLIKFRKLKKTYNSILISNIDNYKTINSKEAIKKFLLENRII